MEDFIHDMSAKEMKLITKQEEKKLFFGSDKN